jgi:hypothetical protein
MSSQIRVWVRDTTLSLPTMRTILKKNREREEEREWE